MARGGEIYDEDGPGFGFSATMSVGTIRRLRFNFREWAEFGGTRCSPVLQWYARESIKKTADPNTWNWETGVSGDNQIGQGQTSITWDLQ